MSYVSAGDTQIVSGNKPVFVHFAQACTLNPSLDQVAQAIVAAGGPSGDGTVSSVADVSIDKAATLTSPLSVLTIFYIATINVVDGTQAGDLRNTIFNALTALGSVSMVSCNNYAVGTIEFDDGSGMLGAVGKVVGATVGQAACQVEGGNWNPDTQKCEGAGAGLTTTALIGFVAVIAVVLLIFVKVR